MTRVFHPPPRARHNQPHAHNTSTAPTFAPLNPQFPPSDILITDKYRQIEVDTDATLYKTGHKLGAQQAATVYSVLRCESLLYLS